ncbi:FAD-dependent oxidoreductase [Sorangium sp. So ce406]|uniref:FAD-dependent oxidoreductase n=1 Tax=Sorangium sp. So ce406 TaxID=3133311 RepID=UPI003F5C08B7
MIEVPSAGRQRGAGGSRGAHAVVIGASMAGLVTARVLSEHFARVTLVDRDRLPGSPDVRRCVPQGRHVHVLLGAGLDTLGGMFPGILEELTADGALVGDFGERIAWYHGGVWKVQFASGIPLLQCSRAFLEHHVRQRVRSLPNVEILDETTVSGLRLSADRARVTGVTIERPGGGPDELTAELVADASGRGSRAPQWLEAAGYARPPESEVEIDIAYVSRVYRPPERYRHRPVLILIAPRPPAGKRAGFMCSVEGDRWYVSLCGYFGEHPPLDDAGFVEFSRTIARPEIHELIKDAEPLTSPTLYRFPADRRRHFERMQRQPDGFVVLGDAACAFDPLFGQGMTVACLGAGVLARCLCDQPSGDVRGLARRFQRALSSSTDLPWRLATTEDLLFPEAEGERPFWFGAMRWYNRKLAEVSAYDTAVYGRWLLVMHLMRGLITCFAPSVVIAVLRHAVREALMPSPGTARAAAAPLRRSDPATRARLTSCFTRTAGEPRSSGRGPRLRGPRPRIRPTADKAAGQAR